MLCLSIIQPWPFLILAGHKPVENRSWPTKVRGRVLIHAGKKFDQESFDMISGQPADYGLPANWSFPPDFDRRGIIGSVEIVDCVKNYDSPWSVYGAWKFVMVNPTILSTPIPYRGQQGFFNVPNIGELIKGTETNVRHA